MKKSCFHQIRFDGSKNGKPLTSLMSPLILPCLKVLEQQASPANYTAYNSRLKKVAGADFSSHSLRKFIVNLNFVDSRNVGGWKGTEVMKKHYLDECTVVADFHKLMKSYDLKH